MRSDPAFLFLLVSLTCLLACGGAPDAQPTRLPSGERGFNVSCAPTGMNLCYDQASKLCRAGYDIVNSVPGNSHAWSSLLIKCKAAYGEN